MTLSYEGRLGVQEALWLRICCTGLALWVASLFGWLLFALPGPSALKTCLQLLMVANGGIALLAAAVYAWYETLPRDELLPVARTRYRARWWWRWYVAAIGTGMPLYAWGGLNDVARDPDEATSVWLFLGAMLLASSLSLLTGYFFARQDVREAARKATVRQ